MAKMSKIARVLQITSILFSLSLSTLDAIEALIRKDKRLSISQKSKF